MIIAPVLRGDIVKVATDQKNLDTLDNPLISEFNSHTNFSVSIKSDFSWQHLDCGEMSANLITQRENIELDCSQGEALH